MAEPARHLRPVEDQPPGLLVVNPATGESRPVAEITQPLEDQIEGTERDLRSWRTRYANLLRDKEAEAEESPVWPAAVRVFDYWRERTGHGKSEWTYERFEMIRPHLERSNTGKGRAKKLTPDLIERNEEICKLAVDGLVFDPFTKPGKNGRLVVHDGLHLAFGGEDPAGALEKRCKAAPIERIREVFPPKTPEPAPPHEPDPLTIV